MFNLSREDATVINMDISTGHMVLAYMEDHLKNKQRLDQEWVSLCTYEADQASSSDSVKVLNYTLKLNLSLNETTVFGFLSFIPKLVSVQLFHSKRG